MNNGYFFESHCVHITDRNSSEFTGIDDVLSFDEYSVCAHSSMGDLLIEGEQLKIESFSSEKGLLNISGKIIALSYTESKSKKHSSKKKNPK